MAICLRIQRSEPLRGIAVTEDGSAAGFAGWVELLGAVRSFLVRQITRASGDRDALTSPTRGR